jgi:ATP-binding cassette subfamily C protein
MISQIRKINLLLTKRQRLAILGLVVLLSIVMILEMLSLTIIVPLISFISDSDNLKASIFFRLFNEYITTVTTSQFFKIFLGVVFFLYLVKTIFSTIVSVIQFKFLASLQAYIKSSLLTSYLYQRYSFHLSRNTNSMIKNIQIELPILIRYIQGLVTFIVESCLVFAVVLTLLYIAPVGAISVGIFLSVTSMVFFNFSKRKMLKWGKEREEIDVHLTKTLLESLGGFKDLKVLRRESFFTDKYRQLSFDISKRHANSNIFLHFPRLYLELISIFGIVGFIFILLIQDSDYSNMIAVLGVFVAGTFRLIPSINKILASLQNMKFQDSALDLVVTEFQNLGIGELEDKGKPYVRIKKRIDIKNIYFRYEGVEKFVIKNLNLKINKGEIIGISGKSGSGKSTLIDLILGLHKPTSGIITVDNERLVTPEENFNSLNIGYVPQQIFLTDDTIENNITLGLPESKISPTSVNKAIESAQLKEFIEGLPKGINTIVGERGVQISGGQMQRIGIARALYTNPEVLILDEATSALDNVTEHEFVKAIEQLKTKKTIIMVAHRTSSLKYCDHIYEMKDGKLIKI